MKILKTILSVCILLTSATVDAQVSAPKYSNEFLSIGVGARGMGMSNSQVAHIDDVTAGYWNPAGLLHIENDIQVAGMHAEYFAGIAKYDYGAVSKRIDSSSVFGFSLIRFGVDDIPNTTDLIDNQGNVDYNRITTFSAADYGFIFSYARDLGIEGLSLGANAKVIYRQIGSFASAFGFGLDAGAQYSKNQWKLGLMARDITTTFNAWSFSLDERTKEVFESTGNELPSNGLEITLPKIIFGAARTFETKQIDITAEIDFEMTTDGRRNALITSDLVSFYPMIGVEADYQNTVFLRLGAGNMQKYQTLPGKNETSVQPNLGLGIRIKKLYLDYALTDIGNSTVALYSNVFSLRLEIH